jgi:aspartyl/asparaginyl beta-hydroxylase (cupin superfamily)
VQGLENHKPGLQERAQQLLKWHMYTNATRIRSKNNRVALSNQKRHSIALLRVKHGHSRKLCSTLLQLITCVFKCSGVASAKHHL